jgi:hypothetical protein
MPIRWRGLDIDLLDVAALLWFFFADAPCRCSRRVNLPAR